MKNKLLQLIDRIIEILVTSGWKDKARWFSELGDALQKAAEDTEEFEQNLSSLDSSLAGIGSFSDLPLHDEKGKVSDQQLRSLQWQLVEEIGSLIENINYDLEERRKNLQSNSEKFRVKSGDSGAVEKLP